MPPPPPLQTARRPGGGASPVLWILLILGLFILVLSLFLNLVLGLSLATGSLTRSRGNLVENHIQGSSRDKILVINVNGLISSGETVLFFPAPNMVEHVKQRLDIAARSPRIKAVILRVDSPGGTVTASDEIFKAIEEFKKESRKPVVSLMGSVAASGGYYVSMACDHVVAHKATMTGSIGVIMQFLNYRGLSEKYGVKWETITPENAHLKSIGSGSRETETGEDPGTR
jgi:protease-4